MAQAAAVTINDGQATPVAVTFNPERVGPDLAVFADRRLGISMLFPRISVSTKFASGQSKVNRAQYTVSLPIGQVVDGQQTVARTYRANVEIILPDGGSDAERKDAYAYLVNGLNATLIKGALRDLDPLF